MTILQNTDECPNLFGHDITSFTDKKDIMPTNGCTKLFVGIISCEKQDSRFTDIFDTKVDLNPPSGYSPQNKAQTKMKL